MTQATLDTKGLQDCLLDLVGKPSFLNSWDVAKYVRSEFEQAGIALETLDDHYHTLLGEVGEGPGLLLGAHLDTVKPAARDAGAVPSLRDGKCYGLGASDDKSGVATLIEIARRLDTTRLRNRIIFFFSGKEENVSADENPVNLLKTVKARRGIYLEPTVESHATAFVGMGSMGLARWRIKLHGRKTASWNSEKTLNPILLAGTFIQRFSSASQEIRDKGLVIDVLGQDQRLASCVNITQIEAMEGAGVIPSECVLTVDARLLPSGEGTSDGEHDKGQTQELEAVICDILAQLPHLDEPHPRPERTSDYPGYMLKDKSLYEVCATHLRNCGFSPRPWIAPARSDGTLLTQRCGIPTVVIGPGRFDQCHVEGEHVPLDEFLRCAEAVWRVVQYYAYENPDGDR